MASLSAPGAFAANSCNSTRQEKTNYYGGDIAHMRMAAAPDPAPVTVHRLAQHSWTAPQHGRPPHRTACVAWTLVAGGQ
eukprot:gene1128-2657_t